MRNGSLMGMWFLFWMMEIIQNWVVVMVIILCEYTKNQVIVCFNRVNLILDELDLKTTVIKKVEDILKNTGIPITDINGNILTGTKDIENLGIEI